MGSRDATPRQVGRVGLPSVDVGAMLKEMPPTAGYQGFQRLSRGVIGQTFGEYCRTARELVKRPEADAMTSEAFTTPRSVRHAGRVVLRGRNPRMDLQELHTRQERENSLKQMLECRDRAKPLMNCTQRRDDSKFHLSFQPAEPEKIYPATMDPAGAPSICEKLDKLRLTNYYKERNRAIRENDIPSAIRR
mmetsp:Transcript_12563/g.21816  ORF Transcript_12563/g.21816 Transcript_12563/m.21816 type:complete len:191 (-) Transcript_12563:155-727(-)